MYSKKSCPSYINIPNAFKIGDIDKNGKTMFLKEAVRLDESSFGYEGDKIANERYAGLCMEGGCHQWSSKTKNCGVAERVMHEGVFAPIEDYENCPIKTTCRWRDQYGVEICSRCVNIIRDTELFFSQLSMNSKA